MKKSISRRQKLEIMRFITGQIPIFFFLVIIFSGELLKLSLFIRVAFGILFLANVVSNIYFIREIKYEQENKLKFSPVVSPRTIQIMFILLFICLGGLGIFRGFTALETYQQIIGFICAFISFLLASLLAWGLKYYRLQD
ncbi:hypothetical protein [Streptococcus marmotae]|uniref:hypothetical protein n=1 Tax=Streptococcus marmotae TaxID=1825069 RepID=UPI00082EBDCC|nr:hypothetical protein [Streptococcus marmotae]